MTIPRDSIPEITNSIFKQMQSLALNCAEDDQKKLEELIHNLKDFYNREKLEFSDNQQNLLNHYVKWIRIFPNAKKDEMEQMKNVIRNLNHD